MSEPTQEQIKEFWEGCGFSQNNTYGEGQFYNYPDGGSAILPELDLNNLFKYAVPDRISEITFMYASNCVSCDIEDLEGNFFEGHIDTEYIEEAWKQSALALFWALRQVKEKSNE